METMTMDIKEEISIQLKSRFTIIHIVSYEEERVINSLKEILKDTEKGLFSWDVADGYKTIKLCETQMDATKYDPLTALEKIDKFKSDAVFVLKDYHHYWKDPRIMRKLRNLALNLKQTKKTIIILSPISTIPEELKDDISLLEFPNPDYKGIEKILDELTAHIKDKIHLTPYGKERLIKAALGLSSNQTQRVFAKAIVTNGKLDEQDIELITSEKKQIIRESGALEFYTATERLEDIGGLENLKTWLKKREQAFSDEAAKYGLPTPKGIALIGVPGTGKSLTAKMVSSLWKMPLLRLDMGAIFGSLVGQSEENMRRAIRLAETISPCLLWIDEMEKGFAGATSSFGDSGTSARVFGSFITWMQEKTNPVFVIATANEVEAIPSELLRKGRFDEIFFLDLPDMNERKEIFVVHLKKRRPVTYKEYNLDLLAKKTDGFVGAEIEQAIIDAMHNAFDDDKRDFTTQDIIDSLETMIPLSKSQRAQVERLREWLREGKARSASKTTIEFEEKIIPILEV